MLKLIVSQTDPTSEVHSLPREMVQPVSHEPFSANVHPKGPLLYIMAVQDPSHFLDCELILEVETNQNEGHSSIVICHFPQIIDTQLKCFVEEDDILFDIIKTQFQMKVLEQLLLFSANQYASSLVIYTDDESADDLKIYRDFLSFGQKSFAKDGENMEVIVPVNEQIYGDWINYMNQKCLNFRQLLWRGQRTNYAIKNFLKSHPFG